MYRSHTSPRFCVDLHRGLTRGHASARAPQAQKGWRHLHGCRASPSRQTQPPAVARSAYNYVRVSSANMRNGIPRLLTGRVTQVDVLLRPATRERESRGARPASETMPTKVVLTPLKGVSVERKFCVSHHLQGHGQGSCLRIREIEVCPS